MSSVEKHAAMRAEGWQFSTAENEFVGTVGARFFYAYTIATVLQHLKCMYVSMYVYRDAIAEILSFAYCLGRHDRSISSCQI